ncbi:unnamed protein product [Allacma fusca]|uniref:Uncharacterized protein n=1 Tax=Allacma fusca TaxID=39272 RepID=A0A8J2PRU1_9HEXA|nr:unnamed protein product [Allacma fusca]
MWSQIFGFVLCLLVSIEARKGFEDGHVYEIKSHSDRRVLSVVSSPESGSRVFLETVDEEGNQKWLAVATDSDEDKFLLLPKRQTWDWDEFKKKKDTLKHRVDSLPDGALVLTEDKHEQTINVQKNRDKSSQKWKAVKIENKTSFLLKNVASERCLKNLNKKHGIFGKLKDTAKDLAHKGKHAKNSHPETVTCDKSDKDKSLASNVMDISGVDKLLYEFTRAQDSRNYV